jgi:hypothetical protein
MKRDVGGIKYYIPTRPFAENSDRSPTDLSYLDGFVWMRVDLREIY